MSNPLHFRALYLSETFTSQSPLPLRALCLSEPSTFQSSLPFRALCLSEPSTFQSPLPLRDLYLSEPSTNENICNSKSSITTPLIYYVTLLVCLRHTLCLYDVTNNTMPSLTLLP